MSDETYKGPRLLVARHGQCEGNQSGILNGWNNTSLSTRGVLQALELGKVMQRLELRFAATYCSPLLRAQRTAGLVTAAAGLPKAKIVSNLIERNFGEMAGQPVHRIEELCRPHILKADMVTYFLNPEGGENFDELYARATRVLQDLTKQHGPDDVIMVFTHNDTGLMLHAAAHGLPWRDVLQRHFMGNCQVIDINPKTGPQEDPFLSIPPQEESGHSGAPTGDLSPSFA